MYYEDNKDIVPITHTIECHIPKRVNRINKELGRYIKKLYIDEDKSIDEIVIIVEKSEAAINKYLTTNKLL